MKRLQENLIKVGGNSTAGLVVALAVLLIGVAYSLLSAFRHLL